MLGYETPHSDVEVEVQNETDEQLRRPLTNEEKNEVLSSILSDPALQRYMRILMPVKKAKMELRRMTPAQIEEVISGTRVKLNIPEINTGNAEMDRHLRIETARMILIKFIINNPWFDIALNAPYNSIRNTFSDMGRIIKSNPNTIPQGSYFLIKENGTVDLIQREPEPEYVE